MASGHSWGLLPYVVCKTKDIKAQQDAAVGEGGHENCYSGVGWRARFRNTGPHRSTCIGKCLTCHMLGP